MTKPKTPSPTECAYAPPGEYIKDHTLVFHDGWWHLFAISGTAGYYHGYNGNEETFSWSISRDLVNWEMRGHVLHASQRAGMFDQHEVWAPFCLKAQGRFYLFYTGIIHPSRPMEYRKLGHSHPWVWQGHKETQGLAVSQDLTDWVKVSDPQGGSGVPGRDSHVVRDEQRGRWLLYSTIGAHQEHVSESQDLLTWRPLGACAELPPIDPSRDIGATTNEWRNQNLHTAESITVMRHPLNNRWVMLANWHYVLSDDPVDFRGSVGQCHDTAFEGATVDIGYAGEMVEHEGRWYRSGVIGLRDYWKLGFTEVEWVDGAAFRVAKPSVMGVGKQ
jgi:hypothetical protein